MAGRGQYTRPVVVVAFEGWNDAADAATAVVEHLAETYPTEIVFEIDSDDYYDYQIVRPRVVETDDGREVVWPSASVRVAHLPERDVLLVSGPEPNLHWQRFCSTLVSAFRSFEPEMVILLGAMLTDSPHSRPLPVTGNTSDTGLAKSLGLEPSGYEGPTGITGVLGDACHRAGLREVSLWASVPHYVAAPPNPKATLALLARLEDLLDVALRLDDLLPGGVPGSVGSTSWPPRIPRSASTSSRWRLSRTRPDCRRPPVIRSPGNSNAICAGAELMGPARSHSRTSSRPSKNEAAFAVNAISRHHQWVCVPRDMPARAAAHQ